MSDPTVRLNLALEGRYAIERELGEGGMATVYLAEDLKHHRRVALKVLKPELAAVVGADRFLAEIETTANLQHPHILPLFDSGEADSLLFYVMPYVEGESLRDRLDRDKQLPVDEAVRIATAVANALQAAHDKGVIHRDIKPANILLSRGEPLVADFGIALAVGAAGGDRLTETGLSLGTPHYMSPEQATGDQTVAPATDIYALGCVLYEMLVGEPPYTGSTAQAVLGRIITGTPDLVTEHRKAVPANVDAAIHKALEKLPADRFTGAQGFAQALAHPGFRHGEAGAGVGRDAATGRWKALAITFGAVALTLAVVGALTWPQTEPVSTMRFHFVTPPQVSVFSGSGVGLAVSPDDSMLVFVGVDPTGATQLWKRYFAELDPVRIPGTDNARNPRFSPDGTSLAFTANGGLSRLSLSGAPPLELVASGVPDRGGGGLAWGPDGWIYFRRSGAGIWRVPEDGGQQEKVTTLSSGETGHEWLDALPNGKGILFSRSIGGAATDEIGVLSLETGKTSVLLRAPMARYARSGHIVFPSPEGTLLAAPFDPELLEVTGPARTVGEAIRVNSGSASQFSISASGTLAYAPGAGPPPGVPVWLWRDGSVEAVDRSLEGHFDAVALSPDGTKIATTHARAGDEHHIWIYDLDQGTMTRLTREGGNRAPFWSPDGTRVGFHSNRSMPEALFERPADGSGTADLLTSAEDGIEAGTWSPDGEWLVYPAQSGAATDLYALRPGSDSLPQLFLGDGFNNRLPQFSPDGRWLAYASNESGRFEVYVRAFPASGSRIPISVAGGVEPLWTRDGSALIYRSSPTEWTVATLRTERDLTVLERELFAQLVGVPTERGGGLSYSVSPEAERLLVTYQPNLAATGLVVVFNFFEELKRVVPN